MNRIQPQLIMMDGDHPEMLGQVAEIISAIVGIATSIIVPSIQSVQQQRIQLQTRNAQLQVQAKADAMAHIAEIEATQAAQKNAYQQYLDNLKQSPVSSFLVPGAAVLGLGIVAAIAVKGK